jgi:hypothetical protein
VDLLRPRHGICSMLAHESAERSADRFCSLNAADGINRAATDFQGRLGRVPPGLMNGLSQDEPLIGGCYARDQTARYAAALPRMADGF